MHFFGEEGIIKVIYNDSVGYFWRENWQLSEGFSIARFNFFWCKHKIEKMSYRSRTILCSISGQINVYLELINVLFIKKNQIISVKVNEIKNNFEIKYKIVYKLYYYSYRKLYHNLKFSWNVQDTYIKFIL